MLAITQFEVYVLDHGRWTIHARYGSDQRKAAIMDARNTEFTTGLPTKVIAETYFPEIDEAELVTAYISPKARERREAAKQIKRGGGSAAATQRPAPATATTGKQRRPVLRPSVNVRQYLMQGVVAAAFSLVAATLSTVVLSWGLRRSIEAGLPISPAISNTIITSSYAVFFLFFFMSLFRSKLPLHRMISYLWQQSGKTAEKPADSPQAIAAAIAPRLRPKQPAALAEAAAARAREELKMLRGDPEPEPEPVYNPPPPMPVAVAAPVEPPPEIEVLSEKEKKKREKSRKEDAEKAAKAAEKAAADAAAAATAAAAEAAKAPPPEPLPLERAVIRRFTMDVLKPATAGTVPDDPVTRCGVSLVIAGAAAALADTARTTPAGKLQLIEEALTILGVNSASVAMFLHQHDELISIPANASLVALGRSALAKHLDGVDVARILAVALAGWRAPHGQPAGPAPAEEPVVAAPPAEVKAPHDIYLLTELRMGPAFVMTPEGLPDGAAEAARDAAMGLHNSVVRSVLSTHAGHEVKHTGMGIFAQFKDAGVAVAAATEMQRRFTATYGPKLAIAIIAKNDEDDDPLLTPNLVRQAQTVAAQATNGEILVEQRVRRAAGLSVSAYDLGDEAELVRISTEAEAEEPALYEHAPNRHAETVNTSGPASNVVNAR
jgi:hypothetical protein